MNNKILLRTALKSIVQHKGRSLLTTLGINIGIAAIIAILAIGHGAEERIKNEILSAGKNSIYIHRGQLHILEKNKGPSKKAPKEFSYADIESLRKTYPTIDKITPFVDTRQTIKYLNNCINGEIKGGNEDLITATGRKIYLGTPLFTHHIQSNARVIVLGNKAAQELFKSLNPIGQIVYINNITFTVIGVLEKLTTQWGGAFYDANLDCFIPITTAKKYFFHTLNTKVDNIVISAKNYEDIPNLVKNITKHLRMRHQLEIKEPNDFTIFDQESILKAAQASSGVLTFFLLIVACISLLVGGIGVMNIMLVSVGERTQEIGIRMALGAQDKIILRQFLYEAFILCCTGGLLGIFFGIGASITTNTLLGWNIVIKMQSIFIAFFAIFLIGLIFGYYPARRASKLNPVDALNDQ